MAASNAYAFGRAAWAALSPALDEGTVPCCAGLYGYASCGVSVCGVCQSVAGNSVPGAASVMAPVDPQVRAAELMLEETVQGPIGSRAFKSNSSSSSHALHSGVP